MSGEKKELSPLAKQLLGGSGHIEVFTQAEFDDALAVAKACGIEAKVVGRVESTGSERREVVVRTAHGEFTYT